MQGERERIEAVIRMLEVVQEGSNALDMTIAEAIHPFLRDLPRVSDYQWMSPTAGLVRVTNYTQSVDDALMLVGNNRFILDKRPYAKTRQDGYRAEVYPQGDPVTPTQHWGPTPALALTIAALSLLARLASAP